MNKDLKEPDDEFWKCKLMAFLHDPPCKPLDFGPGHEQLAWKFCLAAGMTEEDHQAFRNIKDSDHTASAADRFPFPKRECSTKFTGKTGETFIHPVSGGEYLIDNLGSTGKYQEVLQDAFGGIKGTWKQKFFLYWRRWQENAVEIAPVYGGHLSLMPAETRLPDHTIWTHMAVTSALQGCRNTRGELKPAFLIFQAGPVQEFIAQARSTRDLWSGSYMLAWLTGNAMKAISDKVGPDSFIFPALKGLGIFDILNKDIYDNIEYQGKNSQTYDTLWKRLYNDGDDKQKQRKAEILLNPALPNRFFAVVPEEKAVELAQSAEKAFRDALKDISEHSWGRFKKEVLSVDSTLDVDSWKERWDKQVELVPQITWQVMPVEQDIPKILQRIENLPVCDTSITDENGKTAQTPLSILKELKDLAEKKIPEGLRDLRYFSDTEKTKLNNWAFTWSANYALCEYALAARRNTREFDQFITDDNQKGSSKDSLSGKDEIIGIPDFWNKSSNSEFFKNNEGSYGAISVIKRFWCRGKGNYLCSKLDIDENIFKKVVAADSVEDTAKKNHNSNSPYVAIIAMDGDSMGKWMSGEKAPKLLKQMSQKTKEYFESVTGFDTEVRRPLTPSYHLQFSEALGNFANYVAGKIVKAYDGQLIYAGGDDVLAMIPADKALECSKALRAAFRGDKDFNKLVDKSNQLELAITTDGFVKAGTGYPLIVPGKESDVSCGIAIAHYKYPLQRMVKEAQAAEKRAKNEYDRGAFAVSLLKRGGEIVYWGSKWDNGALSLYSRYCKLREDKQNSPISARFPYALAGLLAPHEFEKGEFVDGFDPAQLIHRELDHVLEQQVQGKSLRLELKELCNEYLEELAKGYGRNDGNKVKWDDFTKLFLTAAFIERDRSN